MNETVSYKLKSGIERVIRLLSVKEQRDSVAKFVRRADVRVEIDGRPLDLVCAPYVMPTETRGLRILVDTTSGWGNVSRRAQLSLWDAGDPIVDTKRFGFPLRNFRLFSHASQAYNEPVHLGAGDGDRGARDSTTIMDSTWPAMKAARRSSAPPPERSSCSGQAARTSAR